MSTLNSTILAVTRRTTKGFTVGEIFDRVTEKALAAGAQTPSYNSVRARVYELANNGSLLAVDTRPDSVSGRTAAAFVHV